MSINAKTVVRVIIEGEWIWVERGTFTVVPFEFVDDDGNNLFPSKTPAYFFTSTNGDPYFGPLSAISLMKLDAQLLEETEGGPRPRAGGVHALGPGDGSAPTGGVLVADRDGATHSVSGDAAASSDGGATPASSVKKKAVPLFAGDEVDDEVDDEATQGTEDTEGAGAARGAPADEEPAEPGGVPVGTTAGSGDPDPTEPTSGRRRGGGLF